jgi:hypothetical protein
MSEVHMLSVIKRLPNSLYPAGRIHGKTCGCKWSLLKVREGNTKGPWQGPNGIWKLMAGRGEGERGREREREREREGEGESSSLVLLKPMLTHGKGVSGGRGKGGSQARCGRSLSQTMVNPRCNIFL